MTASIDGEAFTRDDIECAILEQLDDIVVRLDELQRQIRLLDERLRGIIIAPQPAFAPDHLNDDPDCTLYDTPFDPRASSACA